MNEVLLNKKASIERCVAQVQTFYALKGLVPFEEDYLRQDAITMNLQRACELTIDMANHLVKIRKLGLPQDSRESFVLLQQADLISAEQSRALQAMVGFRNTVVHDYRRVNLSIVVEVIEERLGELLAFANRAVQLGEAAAE
jgi:uncharacterized protein YutE (UPF0331/DUF86 family)